MLNFVDWSVVNDVSKDRYAFIFKVQQFTSCKVVLGLLNLENEKV
jgi:hypothetical protein